MVDISQNKKEIYSYIAKTYLEIEKVKEKFFLEKGINETGFDCVLFLGANEYFSEIEADEVKNKKLEQILKATRSLKGIHLYEIIHNFPGSQAGLSNSITNLERKGYVIKLDSYNCKRLFENQRVKEIVLTKKGVDLYNKAIKILIPYSGKKDLEEDIDNKK